MSIKDTFQRLEDEIKKRGLYDAVSARVDIITENAQRLPNREYSAISVAVSEILMLVATDGRMKV